MQTLSLVSSALRIQPEMSHHHLKRYWTLDLEKVILRISRQSIRNTDFVCAMPALPTRTRKRSHQETDPIMTSIPTRSAKRKQTDPQAADTNSETSRTSQNDAIFSDNESISQATNQTDVDSDSELSSSSEEPSSESEDDSDNESDTTDRASTQDNESITNLRPGTKPNMKLGTLKGGLLQRLKTFIPELAAANQELEKERLDGTIERRNIERVGEGDGPFIELVSGQYSSATNAVTNYIAYRILAWAF